MMQKLSKQDLRIAKEQRHKVFRATIHQINFYNKRTILHRVSKSHLKKAILQHGASFGKNSAVECVNFCQSKQKQKARKFEFRKIIRLFE